MLAVKGGLEFLLACEFEEKLEATTPESAPEKFLVFPAGKADDVGSLVQALEVLQTGEPVPLKLYRDPTVRGFVLHFVKSFWLGCSFRGQCFVERLEGFLCFV